MAHHIYLEVGSLHIRYSAMFSCQNYLDQFRARKIIIFAHLNVNYVLQNMMVLMYGAQPPVGGSTRLK